MFSYKMSFSTYQAGEAIFQEKSQHRNSKNSLHFQEFSGWDLYL